MTSTTPSSLKPAPRHERRHGLRRWVPGLSILVHYNCTLFSQDLYAGMVLTALLAPIGMGYSEAAGLPAIYGLYATIVPLLVYALFGPSRILVIGPDSALTALIAATVVPLAKGDPIKAASLAAALAVLSGVICAIAGLARFGFITDLLSKPIRFGYLNGIALTLLVGQIPRVCGFKVAEGSILQEIIGIIRGLNEGRANWIACAIGVSCLVVVFSCKRWAPRWPGTLSAVIGAIIASTLFDLDNRAGIAVVGQLPKGLPTFTVPAVTGDEVLALSTGALAVALVSITDMSVLSRSYAMRGNYYVNDNQEIYALGLANISTGFFQGFSVTSSTSRTPVAEAAGAKTQVTGVIGALCIAMLLVLAPQILQNLPVAALGAVVIFACWTILDIKGVIRLYLLRQEEFLMAISCFLGVALLGVIQGIFIAVGLSLILFIWRAWHPYHAILGRVDNMKGYHDISRHPEGRQIPGLVIFRWDAPLFFANAEIFREQVLRAISAAPMQTHWIVVAAEPVTDVDVTAADVLELLDTELFSMGIKLCFAEMKGPVKDRLKQYGLFNRIGTEDFYPTIGKAVDCYLAETGVEWIDWEDSL